MVVQCQSCQARFRVADEKISDRGVRVRCTSCRTIFLVRKDGIEQASQAPTGETVMGMAPISMIPPARQQGGPLPGVRLAQPPASKPPPPLSRPPVPPGSATRNGAPRPAASPAPAADPFGMAELTGELSRPPPPALSRPPPQPARSAPPPARPSAPPPAGLRPKPRLELPDDLDIDLGGPPAPQKSPPQKSAPPKPTPRSAPPPPPLEQPGLPIGKLAPAAASRPPPPPPVFDEMELDDKPAPPPPAAKATGEAPSAPRSPSHDPFAGMDLESEAGEARSPLRHSDPSLSKTGSAPPPLAVPSEQGPIEQRDPGAAAARPAADLAAGEQADAGEATAAPAPPALRRQLIASALTGLIGAALAALLVLGPSAFTQGGVARLFSVGGHELVAVTSASGLYDTVSGKPVFYVRGRIENRGRVASGPVRVSAALVAGGGRSAQGDAVAGVDASPEDVRSLRSAEETSQLVKSILQKRTPAQRRVAAGDSLPFFALFFDPPADLSGRHIQVSVDATEIAAAR